MLASSLGIESVDKERIIRILGYQNLLIDDSNLFKNLPVELIEMILSKLDCKGISMICDTSSYLTISFIYIRYDNFNKLH